MQETPTERLLKILNPFEEMLVKAMKVMEEALDDKDANVRLKAAAALWRLRSQSKLYKK
jgi:hypothetical protein